MLSSLKPLPYPIAEDGDRERARRGSRRSRAATRVSVAAAGDAGQVEVRRRYRRGRAAALITSSETGSVGGNARKTPTTCRLSCCDRSTWVPSVVEPAGEYPRPRDPLRLPA